MPHHPGLVWDPVSFLTDALPVAGATINAASMSISAAVAPVKSLPPPLTEFRQFSRLPIEVRHEIFALASCEPRVVEIDGIEKLQDDGTPEFQATSNALVPAIMHACVDSRAAGMKVYERLTFAKFTGTYINWSVDYVMFKGGTEGLYMTYEGSLPECRLNYDLVLKVERLAITRDHVNDGMRIWGDPGNQFSILPSVYAKSTLIYPSIKEVAVVEVWDSFKSMTDNLSIRPKQLIPGRLPNIFCPHSPVVYTADGARIVQNRWHQEYTWKRVIPGKYIRVTGKVMPEEGKQPKAPKKLPGVARFSSEDLQIMCRKRGVDDLGNRKQLIARLHDQEAAAQQQYREDLQKWARFMLGYIIPADSDELREAVQAARAKAVAKFLKDKRLA